MEGQELSLRGSKRFYDETNVSDDGTSGTPEIFMIVHKASGLVLEVLPTGHICISPPHNGLSQMFYRDGPYMYVCSNDRGLIGCDIESGEIVVKLIKTEDFLFANCGLAIQEDGSIHQKNSKLCFTVKDSISGSEIILKDFNDMPHQIFDVVRVSELQFDFFQTRSEKLGEYGADHPLRQEFNENLESHWPEVKAIFAEASQSDFGSATMANDYYKLSMAPVLQAGQQRANGTVVVTFAADIRDKKVAELLLGNVDGIQNDVIRALDGLKHRNFDHNIMLASVQGKPFESFWRHDIEKICGPAHAPDTLIRAQRLNGSSDADFHDGTVIYNRQVLPEEVADGQVAVCVYVDGDSKSDSLSSRSESHSNKLHIEATGVWNKVTFLETAMMQAVYQVVLAHHLAKRGVATGRWLYESLFRCHLSIGLAKTSCPAMKGALFAGRRTGHHVFTLLQSWYASRFYPNCIGTSSFDAWYTLSKKLNMPRIVPPVGTHAHELSMVFMCLFPELDANEERIPFSQALSHYMYYRLVHQGCAGPMPMLPDTLGTGAFLKAAEAFHVTPMRDGEVQHCTKKVPFLSLINSARQDSGRLDKFKSTLDKYPVFKGSMMASEIDTKEDLIEAGSQGFATFGAGGFMGDSEKVWNVSDDKFSASMAVKAVRVFVDGKKTEVQPVKLGDGEDTVKVTCDAALPLREYTKIVEHASGIKAAAIENPHADKDKIVECDPDFNVFVKE
jgi:hypothetical protein